MEAVLATDFMGKMADGVVHFDLASWGLSRKVFFMKVSFAWATICWKEWSMQEELVIPKGFGMLDTGFYSIRA